MESIIPILIIVCLVFAIFRFVKSHKSKDGRHLTGQVKTIKCKECLAEIPVKAKRCSHCSVKQPKQVGLLGYIFVGSLVIAFAPIIFNSGSSKSSSAVSPERTKQLSNEQQALKACLPALRGAAKFPSSVDFHTFSSSSQQLTNGGVRFSIDLDAKSGLGNELPMRGICEWKDGVVTLATMVNR